MGRPFLTYLLSATLLAACGPTEVTVDGGPISDASSGPAGRIEVESETALTLMYGESSEILVKYFEGRAAGVGVELSFALAGNASDADLMDLNRVTDAAGRAQTTLVAGTVGSAFRLRISAERASPAFVNVSVSDSGFGGITVRADYMGARAESTRRVVTVYSGVECAPADGYPPSAVARQVTLEDGTIFYPARIAHNGLKHHFYAYAGTAKPAARKKAAAALDRAAELAPRGPTRRVGP